MLEFDEAPKGLERLIYASRSTQPGAARLADQVRIITAKSIHNNRLVDITGFLAFGGDRFLQVLEGPAGEVETTFQRIGRDPRHADLVVLGRGSADKRLFRDWNMAQHQVATSDQALLNKAGLATFTPETLDADAALKFLIALGARYAR